MLESVGRLFSTEGFMPHGMCFAWTPRLLWTMVGADLVIALAYYSIPAAIFVGVRRRNRDSYNVVLLMFAAFIFACGTTHLVDILTIWYPQYWLDAAAKVVTAGVSAASAVMLWPVVGRATAYIDGQERMTSELEARNAELAATLAALEKQRTDLQFVNRFSALLDVAETEEEISAMVADAAATILPGSSGAFYLSSEETGAFEPATSWGELSAGSAISAPTCWSYRLSRPYPQNDGGHEMVCAAAGCGELRRCHPIIGGGQTQGLLHIGTRDVDPSAETVLLPVLNERVGLALQNLRLKTSLEYRSTRDALTGLFNRRYLDESLRIESDRAERDRTECSLILLDLDRFKVLNDTHGHDAGDHALRVFASVVQSVIRSSDVACRYGGEEFVVLLPRTEGSTAVEMAERIRKAVEDEAATNSDARIRGLTVSAGVASIPEHGMGADALVAADSALYRAKDGGRNRVERAPLRHSTAEVVMTPTVD